MTDGGKVVAWRSGRALEDELFLSLSHECVERLLGRAIDLHGEEQIDNHIKSASHGERSLASIRDEIELAGVSDGSRVVLGKAARTKKAGWFKSVSWMEAVARDIVGPDLVNAEVGFRTLIDEIFAWTERAES